MSEKKCEACNDTGYYGDNGPGIRGNREYHECDYCEKGKALSHDAGRRERAEKTACRSIPTPALEADVVEKMVKYIKGEPRSRCFRCCDVMPDGCPDCELGQIIKLLEVK